MFLSKKYKRKKLTALSTDWKFLYGGVQSRHVQHAYLTHPYILKQSGHTSHILKHQCHITYPEFLYYHTDEG